MATKLFTTIKNAYQKAQSSKLPGIRRIAASAPVSTIANIAGSIKSSMSPAVSQLSAKTKQLLAENAARQKEIEALQKRVASYGVGGYGGGYGSSGAGYGTGGASTTPQGLAQQIAQPLTERVYKGPLFHEVLPWEGFYGQFQQPLEQKAAGIVDPFVQRALGQAQRGIMSNLAQTGGGYFGRGVGRLGAAQAQSEADRKAQMLDYMGQYRDTLRNYYDLMGSDFQRATELNPLQTPNTPNIPTWEQLKGKLSSYGL